MNAHMRFCLRISFFFFKFQISPYQYLQWNVAREQLREGGKAHTHTAEANRNESHIVVYLHIWLGRTSHFYRRVSKSMMWICGWRIDVRMYIGKRTAVSVMMLFDAPNRLFAIWKAFCFCHDYMMRHYTVAVETRQSGKWKASKLNTPERKKGEN